MDLTDIIRRLTLFNIPSAHADTLRPLLARLLATRALTLGELQTARDIIARRPAACAPEVEPYAYLFIAALFISQHLGHTYLLVSTGLTLIQNTLYTSSSDETPPPEFDLNSLWSHALQAAEKLDQDVLIRTSSSRGDCWYFQKNFAAVEAVSSALTRLETAAEEPTEKELSAAEIASIQQIDSVHILNDDQLAAVKKVASHRFTVITGGPGTGKTTIVCAFLRVLISRGLAPDLIALVAPTGRAAQRMGEALHKQSALAPLITSEMRAALDTLTGSTIHSLLGGRPPAWHYSADNKLPSKLIVVDESSMIDVQLMQALFAALTDDCRVVLLGDKDQLPPVGVGAVLGDIVNHRSSPCIVHLRQSNRFCGSLAKCAAAINEGNFDSFEKNALRFSAADLPRSSWLDQLEKAETQNQCFYYQLPPHAQPTVCHALLKEWALKNGLLEDGKLVQLASKAELVKDAALIRRKASDLSQEIFSALDASRILTVVHHGPYGDLAVNDLLLRARFNGRMPHHPLEYPGIPILITHNTPSLKLWNGDIGVTVRGPNGMVVLFPRGERVVVCPVGMLPEHTLAYSITVHKSQGSEFKNVLVLLPNDETNPLLSRPLVYTGVTRAKSRAVIMSTSAAFQKALRRDAPQSP